MLKNLTGGTVINYGPALPAASISLDGSLFYKTSGDDQGLYVYTYKQDTDKAAFGDQSAQLWVPAVPSGLKFDDLGALISVDLRMANKDLTIYCNNYAQADKTWPMTFFNDLDVIWKKSNTAGGTELMRLAGNGVLTLGPNLVYHSGNSQLADVGKLNGQPGSYYQNASNLNAGTIPLARLPYAPVHQGGGTGQDAGHEIYLGYGPRTFCLQIDSTDYGNTWPISVTGSASTASYAATAGAATNANYASTAGAAQTAVNATNAANATYATNAGQAANATNATNATNANYATSAGNAQTANLATNANNATNAGTAGSVAWTGVVGRPTNVSQFTNDAGYINASQVPPSIPSGTRMLFQQSAAPTGWTKDTTHNDKALRVVSGGVSSGGSVDFSSAFVYGEVGMTSLTVAQLPPHTHGTPLWARSGSSDNYGDGGSGATQPGHRTLSTGNGDGHSHTLNLAVKYVDIIIATKN